MEHELSLLQLSLLLKKLRLELPANHDVHPNSHPRETRVLG